MGGVLLCQHSWVAGQGPAPNKFLVSAHQCSGALFQDSALEFVFSVWRFFSVLLRSLAHLIPSGNSCSLRRVARFCWWALQHRHAFLQRLPELGYPCPLWTQGNLKLWIGLCGLQLAVCRRRWPQRSTQRRLHGSSWGERCWWQDSFLLPSSLGSSQYCLSQVPSRLFPVRVLRIEPVLRWASAPPLSNIGSFASCLLFWFRYWVEFWSPGEYSCLSSCVRFLVFLVGGQLAGCH